MKRVWRWTAALVAAVLVLAVIALPARRLDLPKGDADGTVAGVIHVHTSRSDGRGSPDEVAAAAARARLTFIILTDHGDATRTPDAPVYRHGVLCIDGVEISTTGGHYVALGLPAAPYPLGGEPRDVVEDVKRLGGFGIAAHPDSPKDELAWRDWAAPFDGLELFNPDTGWRRRVAEGRVMPMLRVAARLIAYPFRPAETVASFINESPENMAHWDALTSRRRVVGLAGADAHARLALVSSEPGDNRLALPIPSYEASFEAVSVHVAPRTPLTGQPVTDAASIIGGIRDGHVHIVLDGIATPSSFAFTAAMGTARAAEGDEIDLTNADASLFPAELHVRSNAPSGFTTTVFDGSRAVASGSGGQLDVPVNRAGVYHAEIHEAGRVWVVSNPIYFRAGAEPPGPAPPPQAVSNLPVFDGRNARDWNVERDPASSGTVSLESGGEGALEFRYTLASGAAQHAYAALLRDMSDGLHGNLRLSFAVRADHPMRLSVQLRTGATQVPARWQRSVYVGTTEREVTVFFDDMAPVGDAPTPRPSLDAIRYVMFVVDQTNTKPGTGGAVWFRHISLEK